MGSGARESEKGAGPWPPSKACGQAALEKRVLRAQDAGHRPDRCFPASAGHRARLSAVCAPPCLR